MFGSERFIEKVRPDFNVESKLSVLIEKVSREDGLFHSLNKKENNTPALWADNFISPILIFHLQDEIYWILSEASVKRQRLNTCP